jgi:hypothetical protein
MISFDEKNSYYMYFLPLKFIKKIYELELIFNFKLILVIEYVLGFFKVMDRFVM